MSEGEYLLNNVYSYCFFVLPLSPIVQGIESLRVVVGPGTYLGLLIKFHLNEAIPGLNSYRNVNAYNIMNTRDGSKYRDRY